jgi:peptidoglycan DL-endopeptidase CwlO
MSRRIASIFVIGTAFVAAGCASTGSTPRPFPTPHAPAAPSTPSAAAPEPAAPSGKATSDPSAIAYSITGTALDLRGKPYREGGSDPSGFDCSGFVRYVYAQHGVIVPRTVSEQYRAGRAIDAPAIEAGDLVFFTTVAPGATHVGIALGGGQFVHAPSGAGQVRLERLSAPYWSTRFVGARRVL